MKSGPGCIQGYNAQALANHDGFIIMSMVNSAAIDYNLLQPSIERLQEISALTGINTLNSLLLTDAGYWSHENYVYLKNLGMPFLCSICHEPDIYTFHGNCRTLLELDEFSERILNNGCIGPIAASIGDWCEKSLFSEGAIPTPASIAWEVMKEKMSPYPTKKQYSRRKGIIEPIFAWIKENRGLKRFQRRGILNCQNEWISICLTQKHRTIMKRGLGNWL